MMQQLNLKEGDIVRVTSVSLPKGTFVKLKPCSKDFMELSNHRAVYVINNKYIKYITYKYV